MVCGLESFLLLSLLVLSLAQHDTNYLRVCSRIFLLRYQSSKRKQMRIIITTTIHVILLTH